MKISRHIILLFFLLSCSLYPAKKGIVPDDEMIFSSLKENAGLGTIQELFSKGERDKAWIALTDALKVRSRNRYYFDWTNFKPLLEVYDDAYPEIFENKHRKQAEYQISHYAPETSWQLPFKNLKGEEVTAYELRHLARQQKSADMTLLYFYDDEKAYLDYWTRQVADLMRAYKSGEYDDEGNGIFEYYRAGRRIHTWLFNHHAYYNSSEYTSKNQKLLIQTFVYHGFDLAERTKHYNPGNHHTKGLVALFELAVFLQDFSFSDAWINQSLDGLTKHMELEVNDDGFQFERSVHYHVGDIENYLRVYQLAQINQIPVPELFEKRFKEMFNVLVKIAQPDKNLPVLQDDTDHYLKEVNELGGIFKAGSLLLKDPVLEYFAGAYLDSEWFWILARMLDQNVPEKKQPTYGSLALESTGYYIMRSGWEKDDAYMCISAGLSNRKPDHQHGDMLGVTAYAGGHQILPTYQVNYNEPDYKIFKNSWVKNVVIVDSIPHGQEWKENEGGSGFGKFLKLPEPKTIFWKVGENLDIYVGTHNGYKDMDVQTYRTVLFFKSQKEWVVCDLFVAPEPHEYQQIWQELDNSDLTGNLSRSFENGMNFLILQKTPAVYHIDMTPLREKKSWMVSVTADTFQFITQLKTEVKDSNQDSALEWNKLSRLSGVKLMGTNGVILNQGKHQMILFGIKDVKIGKKMIHSALPLNLVVKKQGFKQYEIINISPYSIYVDNIILKPGQRL